MKEPRILFDVDGVIANFAQLCVGTVIASGIRNIPSQWVPTQWDIAKELKLDGREKAEVHHLLTRAGVAQTMNPYPDAVDAVLRISKKMDVYFVTSPMPGSATWPHDREVWLRRQFGAELGSKVVHTNHKQLVSAVHLVDDKAENCRAWEAGNPGRAALFWCLPGREVHKDLICLSDWALVESFVDLAVATSKHDR